MKRIAVALALLSLTSCKELVERLAEKAHEADHASDAAAPVATTVGTATAAAPTDLPGDAPPGTAANAKPTPKTASAASPAELEKAFAVLDINGDAQLDGIEVKRCGCAAADANGDGEITKAEYLAAGLLGKFRPGAAPGPTTTTTTTAPPAPIAGGLPPGSYDCFGLVGSMYSARGTLVILDGKRYAHGTDGSGGGTYVFDPATKEIRFTSGLFADPNAVKSAKQVSPTFIQMRTGKGGFYTWDCKR